MTVSHTYLVEFSIGPVQGFIDAARRTSDLWRGSQILGDLSISLVQHLVAQGCELIYPSSKAFETVTRGQAESSVSNIVLVAYKAAGQAELKALAASSRAHLNGQLMGWGEEVIAQFREFLRPDVSTRELADYIECYAAWARVGADGSLHGPGYRPAYDHVKSLLAARKNTRLFETFQGDAGIPKSSLEGINNTVLRDKRPVGGKILQLRLSAGEQLDLVGLLKRSPKNREMFTAISRIAAHDWIAQLARQDAGLLVQLCEQSEQLVKHNLVSRANGNQGKYTQFPFDAQYLFRSRMEVARMEAAQTYDAAQALALESFHGLMQKAWGQHGEPEPYMAMLMADGDRVGELIDKATTGSEHQAISDALFEFSAQVPDLIRRFDGHCVYAGGDDVLAMMPLSGVMKASEALADLFARQMAPVSRQLGVPSSPTLSVGVSVAHVLEPLGTIRHLAASALQYAKGDHVAEPNMRRNALGLMVSPRSGSTERLRIRWDDAESLGIFSMFIEGFRSNRISSKFAYQTREIGLAQRAVMQRIEQIPDAQTRSYQLKSAEQLANNQWARRCKRAGIDQSGADLLGTIYQRGLRIGCEALSRELIVSRWLAAKQLNKNGEAV